jgi:hypothetical protein
MFSLADSCVRFVGFSFLVALMVMYELCFCLFRNEIGGVPLCQKKTLGYNTIFAKIGQEIPSSREPPFYHLNLCEITLPK